MERLCAELRRLRHAPVEAIRDVLAETIQRWTVQQKDDMTLVVLRYTGLAAREAAQ